MVAKEYGPSGGSGGHKTNILPPGGSGPTGEPDLANIGSAPWSIATVTLHAGAEFDAIEVVYRNHVDDSLSNPQKIGGGGGHVTNTVQLNRVEYIPRVTGSYGEHVIGFTVWAEIEKNGQLELIQYYNNAPFGGADFDYQADPQTEEVIGFFGRGGGVIDSIGVYVRPRIVEDPR